MNCLLAAITTGFLLLGPTGPEPMRSTKPDKFPRPTDEPSRPAPTTPPPSKRQRMYIIGLGFEASGTLAGVGVKTVLPDSPAFRAGLLVGCIISEINGETTAGRTGEECARIIREGGGTVRLKFLDAAMRERSVTLEKEWLVVPE